MLHGILYVIVHDITHIIKRKLISFKLNVETGRWKRKTLMCVLVTGIHRCLT